MKFSALNSKNLSDAFPLPYSRRRAHLIITNIGKIGLKKKSSVLRELFQRKFTQNSNATNISMRNCLGRLRWQKRDPVRQLIATASSAATDWFCVDWGTAGQTARGGRWTSYVWTYGRWRIAIEVEGKWQPPKEKRNLLVAVRITAGYGGKSISRWLRRCKSFPRMRIMLIAPISQ